VLGRKRPADEWKILQNDILTFCRVFNFSPTREQAHYLLRVQNRNQRLGMSWEDGLQMGEVIYTCMLWRALCHAQPSICVVGRRSVGYAWVQFTTLWIGRANELFRNYFQVAGTGLFIQASNGVHICQVVGPWLSELTGYTPGKVDVLLGDFEWTEPKVHEQAMRLGKGSLIYLPVPRNHGNLDPTSNKRTNTAGPEGHGADPQRRGGDSGPVDSRN
jgi:hypothetical protein